MNKEILYLIVLLDSFQLSLIFGQNSSCIFQIPTSESCPGSITASIISTDSLVSSTDGSELIRNTNGRLISVAGWDGVGLSHSRIRYSDDNGANWQAAPDGSFAGRHSFSVVEDDGYFYLIGGDNNNTITERAEIWKSPTNDGLNWTLHFNSTPFGNQVLFQVINFNGVWYAIGGQFTNSGAIFGNALRTVYTSSDKGLNWNLLNENVMPEVGATWACTIVFKNKVYIVSGGTYNYGAIVSNKVYSTSDFLSWEIETEFVLPVGVIFNRVFTFEDYIWTHGGYDYSSGNTNYTFVSRDGKIWCDVTNANTLPIHATAVVGTPNGWISNQPFTLSYSGGGLSLYEIGSFQKCLSNTTFINISGDNLWSNPINWSRGIPGKNHNVLIPDGTICNYNLSNQTIGRINVNQNATLNLTGNLKIIGSDTFGIRNFGTINLNQGNLDIDSIFGIGIKNYSIVNVTNNNYFLNINQCGCSGLINENGIVNVSNNNNLFFTILNVGNTGIYNNGIFNFRGNGTMIQLNSNGIINSGTFNNNGNLFIQSNLNTDFLHLGNSGSFINNGILIGQSKLGMQIAPSGILENFGVIQNSGGLSIQGTLVNRVNSEFSNF